MKETLITEYSDYRSGIITTECPSDQWNGIQTAARRDRGKLCFRLCRLSRKSFDFVLLNSFHVSYRLAAGQYAAMLLGVCSGPNRNLRRKLLYVLVQRAIWRSYLSRVSSHWSKRQVNTNFSNILDYICQQRGNHDATEQYEETHRSWLTMKSSPVVILWLIAQRYVLICFLSFTELKDTVFQCATHYTVKVKEKGEERAKNEDDRNRQFTIFSLVDTLLRGRKTLGWVRFFCRDRTKEFCATDHLALEFECCPFATLLRVG